MGSCVSTRRAIFFSFLDRYAGLILSIVSSMFIARLLTPAELGIFSVVMVFTAFVSSMRDLGAGQYLVQEPELTATRIRATWTVMLGMGFMMSLVVLCAAYPMGWLFDDHRMVTIMGVIALNFVISPFGSMTYAWLMREMKFESLAVMRFSASLAGALFSVGLAWKDYGPISLALGNLSATVVNAFVALFYRPSHFGWRPGLAEIRRVVGFGGRISATGIAYNLANGVPEMFLGKLQGLAAAGFYSRANGLAQMFQRLVLDATQAVALPLFARARREEGNFREPFVQATSYVTVLGWPFLGALGILAYPLIRLLYGEQWDSAVDIARVMALGMAIGLPAAMCPQALMAAGRSDLYMKTSLFSVAVHVVCVVIGAQHSLLGAAAGMAFAQCISMPVWVGVTLRVLQVPFSHFVRALVGSLAVGAATTLVPLGAAAIFGLKPVSGAYVLLGCAVLGAMVFVFACAKLRHPIESEIRRIARLQVTQGEK